MDVANGRQYAHRDGGVDAGNRHEALDLGFFQGLLGEALIHLRELGAKAVEFSGMANDDASLVLGERLSLQPSPSELREQDTLVQVGVQNRLDPVLETGHLRDKLRSFSHDAPQSLRPASTLRAKIRSHGASPAPPRRS